MTNKKKNRIYIFPQQPFSGVYNYLLTIVIVGFSALLCTPLSGNSSYHLVSYILLLVVSILATFMSTGPILLASTLASLMWNFFFIPPHYTFHIDKVEDILMFALFFIIALLNGILTTRVRRQEQLAREREERTNALFQLTKELSKARGNDEVITVSVEKIKKYFSVESFFILQNGNNKLVSSEYYPSQDNNNISAIAEWAFENQKIAGRFSDNLLQSDYTFYPLIGVKLNPGVVGLKQNFPFEQDKKKLLETFLVQISNALEREFLGEIAQHAKFLVESDRLYRTLFNSISHELRIPIATIMGASDSLLNAQYSKTDQSALCNEIFTASLRLNRIIENLLSMSRLEAGRLSIRLDWYDINDLINKVVESLKVELTPFHLIVDVSPNMPFVRIDFGLMEQVLYNLLFNATEHAPVNSNIRLNAFYDENYLCIQIMDRGEGFSQESMKQVFKKFFRADNNKPGGLGLGLSIVKGFVEAHKGTITVENRKAGGAMFTIRIPSDNPSMQNILI